MAKTILYTKKDHLAVLTLNRPAVLNAINADMQRGMAEALLAFKDDNDARVLIITGAGEKAFSAGTDLKEMAARPSSTAENLPAAIPDLARGTIDIWKPVIAAVNGLAIGGGLELALACDVRIVAAGARLGLMEPKRGIVPGGKGSVRLARMVPLGIALEMLLSGDLIDAQEAFRIGLANQVVPGSEVMPAAVKMAARFMQCAPLALQSIKKTVYETLGLPLMEALAAEYGGDVYASEDAHEGAAAFSEKRTPEWRGK